jgi:hypothetical protein
VGGRGMLPDREERGRLGRLPGLPLQRLVSPHHPGHVGPRLHRRSVKGAAIPSETSSSPSPSARLGRLLAHVITTIRHQDHIWRWSWWRRRHRYRARTSHYQRRLRT